MKKNIYFFISIAILICLPGSIFGQKTFDTVKTDIAIRYDEVRELARDTLSNAYRSYLSDNIIVRSEDNLFTDSLAIDSICKPALAAIKGVKVRVEKDEIKLTTDSTAIQDILMVTIYTDTTRGIPIPHLKPQPKHMRLTIDWKMIDGLWEINVLYQNYWRESEHE